MDMFTWVLLQLLEEYSISLLNLLDGQEEPLKGSNHGPLKSQNLIVSPPNIISPVGDLMRYLPKPVGPIVEPTLAPILWSLTRKVKL